MSANSVLKKIKWFNIPESLQAVMITVVFLCTHLAAYYYKGFQYILLLPAVLIIAFVAFTRIDKFFILTIFCIPISIPLMEFKPELSYSVTLPSELFIVSILVLFILRLIKKSDFPTSVFLHPVSIAIYFNIIWLFIASATSTMPLISFKFLISRIWFLVAFYFLATILFSKSVKFNTYIWAYIIAITVVIFYAISRHVQIGLFDQNASHYVMNPFYRDHTSYGAVLAFLLPVLVGFLFLTDLSRLQKISRYIFLPIIAVALVLSYSRAAWISIIFVIMVLITVLLRIKFWVVLLVSTVVITFLVLNWTEINYRLQKNSTDSSASLAEHVQSITNISNDYSNLERLNRWNSAIDMFKEKPLFGWGPGTYMFQYAPFQRSYLKTPISTNAGDGGNAHSEYLGPLSEAGVLGSLTFIIIIISSLLTGFRVYHKLADRNQKILVLSIILGLLTYILHGILNNFLDTAKVSSLFWGYIAFLVACDIKLKEGNKNEILKKTES